ncbi:hypothetical protein EW145_g4868 [Phellinidium pouzarii]|uniref:Uncharacterized protein n=1 Tax=Phellinidium pouzarii TaxID=167371 RepID=A0A4S4L6T8_9AGAM|nr:hypothetical protein EW145_g4868 [Phellinidium pouzarii]
MPTRNRPCSLRSAIFSSIAQILAVELNNSTSLWPSAIFGVLASQTLMCVLGSHLLVHLKDAAQKGVNGGTSYRGTHLTAMRFDERAPGRRPVLDFISTTDDGTMSEAVKMDEMRFSSI